MANSMTDNLLSRDPGTSEASIFTAALQKKHRQGELVFFAGVLLMGTVFLGPVGIPLVIWGWLQRRRAERQGAIQTIPWHVALVGGFAIGDSAANFIGWTIDFFDGRAMILQTALMTWG